MSLPDTLTDWLSNVLQPQYHNVNYTYKDVLSLLSTQKSLKPRTTVYTSNQGYSELLLNLHGTLPSTYRSSTYYIPIEIWIPLDYPSAPPMVYVVPTQNMILKVSNYVDSNGRFYHPFLRKWAEVQPGNLIELTSLLSQVFSEEPPVFAKPNASYNQSQSARYSLQQTQQAFISSQATGSSTSSNQNVTILPSPPKPPKPPKLPASYNKSSNMGEFQQKDMPPSSNGNYQTRTPSRSSYQQVTSPHRSVYSPAKKNIEEPNFFDWDQQQPELPTNPKRLLIIEEAESKIKHLLSSETKPDLISEAIKPSAPTIVQELKPVHENDEQIAHFEKNLSHNINYLRSYNGQLADLKKIFTEKITSLQQFTYELDSLNPPPIDDIICGETLVFNQMYDLVSEIKAIDDTLEAINESYTRGEIPLEYILKFSRNLAREQFMKKRLVEVIRDELGLKRDHI